MTNELLALGAAATLATAVLAARFPRAEHAKLLAMVLAGSVAVLSIWSVAARDHVPAEAEVLTRPIEVPDDGYVTSAKCRACHAREYSTWHDSYHRKMTQRASPAAVVGDFDDVHLTIEGQDYHLQREGADFWVEMANPVTTLENAPPRVRERIGITTGSHNMQAYWYETRFTRTMGQLPFTWLIAEQRWTSRKSVFVLPPTDPVDPQLGGWSIVCLKCHATHSRPRLDYEGNVQRGADTFVAEFGIACEACHGPGETHVAANRNPSRRYALHLSGEADPTIVNPRRLAPERSTQVCGQCHGQYDYQFTETTMAAWFKNGFAYRPGGDVLEHRKLEFEGDEQFWADGLIRVAGREYNALVGSRCHDRGNMTCLSCHVLHQPDDDARPRLEWANDQLRDVDGDQTCLQCHESYGKDVPSHSHHVAGSEGSRCENCHMPYTTYGLMKGVRNHRIASPSVQSTIATGRPNACNQCHLDRTLEWTASRLHDWYGTEVPKLGPDDRKIAAGVQWALKGDAAQRALMAWSLGWAPAQQASGTEWMVPCLAELIDDPYEVVRLIAERSLRTLSGFADFHSDHTGSAETRRAAKAGVRERWQQARRAIGDDRRAAVLLAADGSLREQEFTHLLRQRNNRVVRLFE
ncbi:MAG TPA: C cytochrome precursor [Planctomycetota bacterium]|nr:C cytochrome precursor [Planctomycetota bacterium]